MLASAIKGSIKHFEKKPELLDGTGFSVLEGQLVFKGKPVVSEDGSVSKEFHAVLTLLPPILNPMQSFEQLIASELIVACIRYEQTSAVQAATS